jgi:serine/threonine protein kinase
MAPGLLKNRPSIDPLLGQQVLGYQLKRLIGKGGMGAVYEAVHSEIRQRAAVKVLFAEYSSDEEFVRRFVYEARAASQVHHPGLVKIYNHGQLADGTAFIMMEFLNGDSLRERLERLAAKGERMPVASVLAFARQIAATLVAVHRVGIVHRDLKPANLILVPATEESDSEQVKLVDFGIAKFDSDSVSDVSKTTVGKFLGTALYASPEQCQMSGNVGIKADVYSLGVVLYEMLSGRPPFVAEQPGMVIGMHLFRQPVPLWEVARQVPFSLCKLVQDMLAKSPVERPSMEQVAARLTAVRLDESALLGLVRQRARLFLLMGCLGLLLAAACSLALALRRSASRADTSAPMNTIPSVQPIIPKEKITTELPAAKAEKSATPTITLPVPGIAAKHKPGGEPKKTAQSGAHPKETNRRPPSAPTAPAKESIVQSPRPEELPAAGPRKMPKRKVDADDEAFY